MQSETTNLKDRDVHPAEIRELFANNDPAEVWDNACKIVRRINPTMDLSAVRDVFDDVMCLFDGSYPNYTRILTPYHDLRHTLDVFMCAVRLLHGVHLSGNPLNEDEISLVLVAALLHDVGYAQKEEEVAGSGAQYTQVHVVRGIEFMKQHISNWNLPSAWDAQLTAIISCTNTNHDLSNIEFPTPRARMMGQIVGTADMVGQMADRIYLEKLLFLYLEFKEADLGNFQDTHDLLKKTRSFYTQIRKTLDGDFESIYRNLTYHFKDTIGANRNFYLESIERNIEYLDRVMQMHEAEWLSMLKRHGIVQAFQQKIGSTKNI